ncbi:hypothetical protein M501DRAFT_1002894 [Patellaria atrata CBS 101060]|uniref:Uncharacterized protein n=1 Tax=Patellaria atrata CBS 101060 TaxID=1346257 RepID=A0A9P4SF97_9PEZI|nr:hypothetical protein M501DRAFT_1002894 [Patellaria atrata CBS 101060]
MQTKVLLATLLAAVAGTYAQGQFSAVGDLFASGGCTNFIFSDPVFADPGTCAPVDRSGQIAPVLSYRTRSVVDGCTGKYPQK